MPVYEFICKDCNDHFDQLVRSMTSTPEVRCEQCSGTNVRRLVSSFATVGGLDSPVSAAPSGGCCGGGCGCGH